MAFGSSQTGRWLRDFVYEGFNADERNRRVFDGVMPHIGGGGAVLLNERWSTPTSLLMETATRFPFSDRKQRDPVTGAEDGLLENPRAADHQPKVFHTMSDTEYWERGGALVHTTPDGTRDIAVPDNVRIYHFASAPHNIGQFPPAMVNGETANNPFDLRIGMRALLVAMERWVRDGTAPPGSRYPRLSDGTLVRATEVAFPALRGVTSPRMAYPGVRGANAPPAAAGWRGRAAAAHRSPGRSRWEQPRRHPVARRGSAARDPHRLDLSEREDRRDGAVRAAERLVHAVRADEGGA